ncbi:glucan 1,4-alpha-glucosidase [Natrarchaeobius sp. A-rgal3]|uniref:glucan 1,4-alpha-glucosidase n=1 Tax=Natrarchaeobius versutus TaxID=1679078 RepID=UPI00350F5ED1
MELHSALNDVKRSRGDSRRFPGERRSTAGLFSGLDDRLVHVAPDGSLRDYSYPLTGLAGIERSRFGLEVDGTIHWFDGGRQRYVDDTAVVETVHEVDDYTLTQYDLTVDRTHLTRIECSNAIDGADVALRACLGFAPEGRAGRVGQLRHGDAVEIHHDRERDFVAASTGATVTGRVPEQFEELLAAEPSNFPRSTDDGRYEEGRLSPIAILDVSLEGTTPAATIATVLSEPDDGRAVGLERARAAASDHGSTDALLEAGREQYDRRLPDDTSADGLEGIATDLRVLAFLRAGSGARIAGPEFDPFFRYTGGYGYTWFRDDAEISSFLLEADHRADIGLSEWHRESAQFYVETQLADGTWPHRVWPHNGRLAPGWAHGRVEDGDAGSIDYQADQTASVATFLATYLRLVDPDDDAVRDALITTLDGLDAVLEDDGLPGRVQNAWENMTGRFTHTAATYLEAYAAIARAPLPDDHRDHAREQAQTVYEGIDALWLDERGRYALRLEGGELDGRLDGSTFALASAHREYDALADVDDGRIGRLCQHVETTLEGLYRDPDGPIEGIARFEGDPWRVNDQTEPKIWTVTTAWGAQAAAELGQLLEGRDTEVAASFEDRGRELLALVDPDGPLRRAGGYLPEQLFDDGTPDSATPLGWPHALRIATATALETTARVEEASSRLPARE